MIMLEICFRINLESSYTLIALLMVEIPCAYTAAAGVCLAMAIQEATFDNDDFNMNQSHRLHATVMAIMSLVCYIFNAKVKNIISAKNGDIK